MHRRLILAGLAATGGLSTSDFCRWRSRCRRRRGRQRHRRGRLHHRRLHLRPVARPLWLPWGRGLGPVVPLSAAPPFLTLGGGEAFGFLSLADQNFEVYGPSTGTELGSVDTNESVSDLFGLTNAEFVVTGDSAAAGGSTSDLPTVGSVYDSFNLGNGYENVYTDIPSTTGGADTVTDTLITPNGDINLDSLFGSIDAAAPLNLATPSPGWKPAIAASAPTPSPSAALPSTPPWRAEAKASHRYSAGQHSAGIDHRGGSLGETPTTPAATKLSRASTSTAAIRAARNRHHHDRRGCHEPVGLHQHSTRRHRRHRSRRGKHLGPADSGLDLRRVQPGQRLENVYTDIPGTGGGADTVTDTLVTPFGNINLDSLFGSFDAVAPMQPGDAFTGLEAGDSSIGADAFTIGSTTFDPITTAGTEGYDATYQILGVPPLMEIGGGTPNIGGVGDNVWALDPQEFDIYSGSGSGATEIGSIVGNQDILNLLGMTNTEFTVKVHRHIRGSADSRIGLRRLQLRRRDRERVHRDPWGRGAADTVTDTLVTPWGNLNLDSLVAASTLRRGWIRATPSAPVSTRPRSGDLRGLRHRPAGFPRSVRGSANRSEQHYQHPRSLGPGMSGV